MLRLSVRTVALRVHLQIGESVNPRLTAINGPFRDSVFPIVETALLIGRGPSNGLSIDEGLISPEHCSVGLDSNLCIIRDLGSLSGTFVNGLPVVERTLVHGDQITVGSTVFVYLNEEHTGTEATSFQLNDAGSVGTAPTRLRREDLRYLNPEALAALPPNERIARDLQTILKISSTLGSIHNVDSLQWQLLGMIFDVIPAERGAIALGPEPDDLTSVVAWDRVAGPQQSVQLDRSVAQQVFQERIALLSQGIAPSSTDASDATASGRSVMCVPLIHLDKVIGLIYLDTANSEVQFSEDDLHLATAIAGVASMALESARHVEWLGLENRRLRVLGNLDHDMVGESPRMREIYDLIERVAASESTVLILGESGTGKELAARAIHRNSSRRDQPFVPINCAALTESLLESELFGHERGAFTGALTQKRGQFEMANAGTIFLDEIGELSPTLQSKLLRVLQERSFLRVGGVRSLPLDIRVIAATNKDLLKATQDGSFRQDLYYRLNVVSLTMPPLREHKEDVPLLAAYFVVKFADKCNRHINGISPEARRVLMEYDWPGNIRELENAIERAVAMGSSDSILLEDLPETLLETRAPFPIGTSTYHEAVRQLKRQLILTSMDQSENSVTEAAKLLGVHPNYLHRLIRNLDLRVMIKKSPRN
jgi:transcriptional regulator with GAF, ATPase, and Fis domain